MLPTLEIREEYCIHCRTCEKLCPNEALTVKEQKSMLQQQAPSLWQDAINALKN